MMIKGSEKSRVFAESKSQYPWDIGERGREREGNQTGSTLKVELRASVVSCRDGSSPGYLYLKVPI